jgi:dienelactone hydrolase
VVIGVIVKIRNLIGICTLLCATVQLAMAQPISTDAQLNETVQMVPQKGFFSVELETTFYKPDGEGPFPIAVINHGKSAGDSRFQERYRPAAAARYFLQRGYAVVVPMRQGFSKSGGMYVGGGCNIESNGQVQADNVKAVLDYVVTLPWADKERIVVLGQSHGGWTTLAFGTKNYPGVKALVNFAGGLRQESCQGWERGLARAAADYAKETRLPSLWFYGDNDSYFKPETYRAMFEQYTAAGGAARLVAFGQFGTDAHSMFGSRAGGPIWQPEVSKLLASVGLPSEPMSQYAQFGKVVLMAVPPKTDFAPLDDEAMLPFVKATGRAGYKAYLTKAIPRAFAIAPNGAWGWANGGDDPLKRSLDSCSRNAKSPCKLYSVDDLVVWNPD